MKGFVAGFILAIALFVVAGLGQDGQRESVRAESDFRFQPVTITNDSGKVLDVPGLFGGEIRFSSGANCYFVSNQPMPGRLDSLDQIQGLGCTKE